MCGIVGGIASDGSWLRLSEGMSAMAGTLKHRGPDDGDIWLDGNAGVALAQTRLSILDLSPAGRQPMHSAQGRFVIVFNGEIYNHLALREELEASSTFRVPATNGKTVPHWRGHSDTETLLAAFETWGIEKTLEMTVGMYAIALWDRATRTLTIARDRLGEKPLYYGWEGSAFLFGSELKALKAYCGFRAEIDRGAIALSMRYNYIPGPHSIYRGIRKLSPGSYAQLVIGGHDWRQRALPQVRQYWSVEQAVDHGRSHPFSGTESEAVGTLENALVRAVSGQMVADVPLGALLSGGLDSSAIVALMQMQSPRPVRTFTIGFNEDGYNEAAHAKAVAKHLGTEHTELYLSAKEAIDVIPLLPRIYDEPFSDASQIPTYLVAQLARRHVTVSLTGDAGDELFGGYNRYFLTHAWWRKVAGVPRKARTLLARIALAISPASWDRLSRLIPAFRFSNFGDKLHKFAGVLDAVSPEAFYRLLLYHWPQPEAVVRGAKEPPTLFDESVSRTSLEEVIERMMYIDQVTYLPDDILVKVDRAAMAVSLETRVPFLDHRVVEFAWSLPFSMKVRNGQGKWILRKLLDKYVPRELVERPKMGFGVPIDSWLRGPLRDWAEGLLDSSRLQREGYLDPAPIRQKWQEHLSGQRNWQYPLWDVLMFQGWLEEQARVTR
jgi:asparagine synthase (glutamine-hydrolysing)